MHADGLARTRGMDDHTEERPHFRIKWRSTDSYLLNSLSLSLRWFIISLPHPGAISLNYLVTVGRRDEMAAAVAVTSSLPFWFFVRLIATGQRGRRISLHDALSEQQIVQVCGDYAARSVRLLREVGAPA